MSKRIAVYPGSFDPVHPGHIHIMAQAALLFDKVVVLIAENPEKSYKVPAQERKKLILGMIGDFEWAKKVTVDITGTTLMAYCNVKHINTVVRGIRNGDDLEYECAQREYSMRLGLVEFPVSYVYLAPDLSMRHFSSTYVRNFIAYCAPMQLCNLYNSTVLGRVLPAGEALWLVHRYGEKL